MTGTLFVSLPMGWIEVSFWCQDISVDKRFALGTAVSSSDRATLAGVHGDLRLPILQSW